MQIVEQHHHRRTVACRQALQPGGERGERAVAQQARVAHEARQPRAGREVHADQLAQHFRLAQRGFLAVGSEKGQQPLHETQAGGVGAVAVGDLQPPRQHVPQQAIGLLRPARVRPAQHQPAAPRMQIETVLQLVQQPALAQAGVGDQRRRLQAAAGRGALEGGQQPRQFGLAADECSLDVADAAAGHPECAWPCRQHEVGGKRLVLTLDLQRWLRLHLEDAAHLTPGVVADAQGADRRALLHARRNVHGEAADRAFLVDTAAEQHQPGVGADADVEAGHPVLSLYLRGMPLRRRQQCQAGAHRTFGIVFASPVGTEGREYAVAGVLKHAPAVLVDDGGKALQRAVHHVEQVFGVELPRQRRRAHHVQEQHRDLASLRCRGGGVGIAHRRIIAAIPARPP